MLRKQAGSFPGDAMGSVDKTCYGGQAGADGVEGIPGLVVECCFRKVATLKEMITIGVKRGLTMTTGLG